MKNIFGLRSTIILGVLDIVKELISDPRIDGKVHIAIDIPENDHAPYIEVRFLKPHFIDPIVRITVEFTPTSDSENIALMFVMAFNREKQLISGEALYLARVEDAKPDFERLLEILDQFEDDYPAEEES